MNVMKCSHINFFHKPVVLVVAVVVVAVLVEAVAVVPALESAAGLVAVQQIV